MLEEIRIQGLGVIDDAVLELDQGFTAVTGETGAGKTMVVTGLSLLLGSRADAGLVRPSVRRAVVEGRIRVATDSAVTQQAEDAGAEIEDGALIVVRTVSGAGGSRAHLGGASVPAKLLGELAEELVALHGQSEQLQLLRPTRQRAVLDRYGGAEITQPLTRYQDGYSRLLTVQVELSDLVDQARERAREADALRHGVAEIEHVAPVAGEDEQLRAEQNRLAHADSLRAAAEQARQQLAGDEDTVGMPDALSAVTHAHRALESVRDHDDALAVQADRLAEASFTLGDVATELASYADTVDTDPTRLAAVSERRSAHAALTRKYGETLADVLQWAESAATRLADLDGSDDRIRELRAQRDELRTELAELAVQISSARTQAAERFSAAVTEELAALAMSNAQVSVRVSQTPAGSAGAAESTTGETKTGETDIVAEQPDGLQVNGQAVVFGPDGVDDVEIQLRPHPGAPVRAVQRGASGGELSRIMLAVEVVLAGVDHVPTLVFDEVDAGVAGRAAVEIGRRLSRLSRHAQVVVVTHLPQVAAFADRHFVVRKSDDGTVTHSGLVRLDGEDRVDELARMLAGLEESDSAREHARELLETAATEREQRATRRKKPARRAAATRARTGS